jgi:hypothetical protein
VAFRINRHAQVSSQLDYVRYSEIEAFVRPGGATSGRYAMSNGLEPRFGAEVSVPLGGASLQLRAGAHVQAPGSFVYSGPHANEAAAFRGSSRRVLSAAGASLVLPGGLTVDVGGMIGGDRPELAAGVRVRFWPPSELKSVQLGLNTGISAATVPLVVTVTASIQLF